MDLNKFLNASELEESALLSSITKCVLQSPDNAANPVLKQFYKMPVSLTTLEYASNSSIQFCINQLLANSSMAFYNTYSNSSSENDEDYDEDEMSASRPFVPPVWLQVTWSTLFAIMVSAAIIGNCSVIYIILAHRRMRTVTNVFLLNLSIADLLMATFNTLFNFAFMITSNWPFGSFYCSFSNFLANLTVSCSVFTIMATAIDRYIAVVHPLKPRMSKKVTLVIILTIWMSSSLLALPSVLYSKMFTYEYADGDTRSICTVLWPDGPPGFSFYDYVYNLVFLCVTYVFPMTAMFAAYSRMGHVLWSSQNIGEVTLAQMEATKAKKKVVKMLITVTVIFAICWLPYHLYFLVTYHNMEVMKLEFVQHLYLLIYFLAMSNSACNPLIYALLNKRFRAYLFTIVCCGRGRGPEGPALRPNFARDSRMDTEHTMVMTAVAPRLRGQLVNNGGTFGNPIHQETMML